MILSDAPDFCDGELPSGTLHLAYETADVPTYGNLAIEEQDGGSCGYQG